MGDIKEKEIKFGPIVDHLKDDPAAGEKYFWDSKRSNLVGDFEINKKILGVDIKSKQIKF